MDAFEMPDSAFHKATEKMLLDRIAKLESGTPTLEFKQLTQKVLRLNLDRAATLSLSRQGGPLFYHDELRECLDRAVQCVNLLNALEGVTLDANN